MRRSSCLVGACLASIVLGTLVALSGCAGDPEPTGPATFDELEQALLERACESMFRCPVAEYDATRTRAFYGTPERCVQGLGPRLRRRMRVVRAGLLAGTLTYDPDAARRCLDMIDRACGMMADPLSNVMFCREAVDGAVPEAGACIWDSECAGDAFCDADPSASDGCAGTCTPRRGPGDGCDDLTECSTVANSVGFCGALETCIEVRLSAARAGLGEPCGTVEESATEWTRTGCAVGLYCRAEPDGSATCAEPLAPGEPCDYREVCRTGYLCESDGGGATCLPVAILGEGDRCTEREATFCDSLERLFCADTGTCEPLPDGLEGSVCRGDTCQEDLFCDAEAGALGTCGPRRPTGAACFGDNDCESGWCDTRSGFEGTCGRPFCG